MRYIFTMALAVTLAWPLGALAQDGGGDEASPPEHTGASGDEATPATPTDLDVVSITLAKGIEDGHAVEEGTSFSTSDGRIFAIIRLSNPSRVETQIRVSWEREGASGGRGMALDVPASFRWRTVARIGTNRPAGRYRCVVRTEDGTELESVDFTLTE